MKIYTLNCAYAGCIVVIAESIEQAREKMRVYDNYGHGERDYDENGYERPSEIHDAVVVQSDGRPSSKRDLCEFESRRRHCAHRPTGKGPLLLRARSRFESE